MRNRNIVQSAVLMPVFVFSLLLLWVAQSVFAEPCNQPGHFEFASITGDDYSLVIQRGNSFCGLQPCDEIGVFDGDLCVGATVFEGSWPVAIVAWQDDIYSGDVDGYTRGNQMSFRIWRSGTEVEEVPDVHLTVGDGTFGDGAYSVAWFQCSGSCCIGLTGNVDNDPDDITDIGDITHLIWYLFLYGPVPECIAEANVDGDPTGFIDIGDLTALIDYLFISFNTTAACE